MSFSFLKKIRPVENVQINLLSLSNIKPADIKTSSNNEQNITTFEKITALYAVNSLKLLVYNVFMYNIGYTK